MSREGGLIIVGIYYVYPQSIFFWLNVKCVPPFCLIFEQQKKIKIKRTLPRIPMVWLEGLRTLIATFMCI